MAFQWLPEDDYLLRKSLEDGTSLETLAKGAVRFSRKFTLSELKDRWHCLLYNPKVTSPSSSVGFELQYGAQFLPQGHYHSIPVRNQYYTARKKRRLELEESLKVNSNAIDEHRSEDKGTAFGECDDFNLNFEDIENFQDIFPDFMLSSHDGQQDDYQTTRFGNDTDDDDDRMVDQMLDQMLNINDEQIQYCDVTVATAKIEHVMLQEVFQDPLFQQPNTSFSETTSHSHEQIIPDQAETWIPPQSYQDLPSIREEARRRAMPLCALDPHPEIINGVLICSRNCESSEIPDNDDINLQLHNPKARTSFNPSSSSLRKHMKPPLPPIRGSSSQAKGNDIVDSYGFGDCAVTTQASCSSAFNGSFTEKATSTVAATTSSSLQHSPENEICEQILSAEMNINAPEENNNEIESDEDLPSFADVEAMILDMDLEPIGQDRYELGASRYRTEEMARMIMRLEQSAESYMNLDIASHGAFALLYDGSSSKHYINKPEVLLGRATGEYPVDIDLGRSGSETRFSRRQALIRLKQDGSFEIENLGKFSIWMNGEEIDHGEVVTLKNSCLIQIREKSFIFETNEKAVKRYLCGILK